MDSAMTHLRRPWERTPTGQLVEEMQLFLRESEPPPRPVRLTNSQTQALVPAGSADVAVVDTLLTQCLARLRERPHGYRANMRVAQWLGERGDLDEVDALLDAAIRDRAISALDREWATLYRAYWQIWTRHADLAWKQIDTRLANGNPGMQVAARIAGIEHSLEHGEFTRLRMLLDFDHQATVPGVSVRDTRHLTLSYLRACSFAGDTLKAKVDMQRFVEELEFSRTPESFTLRAKAACARAAQMAGFPMEAYETVAPATVRARDVYDIAHPVVVEMLGIAVDALCSAKQIGKAREIATQMFVSLVDTKGPDHRLTLCARWYVAQGAAFARAVGIVFRETRTCVAATERIFGRDHRRTLHALLYASWIESTAGAPSTARERLDTFNSRYANRSESAIDPLHVWSRSMDGYIYTCEGRPVDALSILPRVIGDATRSFGPYNTTVLDARRFLAMAMIAAGAFTEGNRRLAELGEDVSRELGPGHVALDAVRLDQQIAQTNRSLGQ